MTTHVTIDSTKTMRVSAAVSFNEEAFYSGFVESKYYAKIISSYYKNAGDAAKVC